MSFSFTILDTQTKETQEWLSREFSSIRTGRASVSLLDSVRPEAYGTRTPISQLASLSVEDAKTIRIIPWDKSVGKGIEKAITEADLGVSVSTDDQGLRVIFPELTAERRTLLMKLAGERLEEARVRLRGHRVEAMKSIDAREEEGGMGEDEVKRLKEEVQKKIDASVKQLEDLFENKKKEIQI